jgi:hypothetical protein
MRIKTGGSARRAALGAVAAALVVLAGPAPRAGAAINTGAFCANVPAGQSGFTDIAGATPHVRNIECLKGSEVTSGATPTSFDPAAGVARGQMAAFLARAIDRANELDAPGAPNIPSLPSSAPDFFSDDDGTVHERSINRLRQAGIVSGQTATTFAPTGIVTRGQMATFVAQALAYVRGAPLPSGPDAFTDDVGNHHETNINRLANADIVDGTGPTTFDPDRLVVRSQMASFLVQSLADLHADGLIAVLPTPSRTGAITSIGPDSYMFTSGNESFYVPYDSTDRFVVDGDEAGEAAFEASLTVGDDILFGDDPQASIQDIDEHRLRNVDPSTLTRSSSSMPSSPCRSAARTPMPATCCASRASASTSPPSKAPSARATPSTAASTPPGSRRGTCTT